MAPRAARECWVLLLVLVVPVAGSTAQQHMKEGIAHSEGGRPEEALAAFRAAEALEPASVKHVGNLAVGLMRAGRLREAHEAMQRSSDLLDEMQTIAIHESPKKQKKQQKRLQGWRTNAAELERRWPQGPAMPELVPPSQLSDRKFFQRRPVGDPLWPLAEKPEVDHATADRGTRGIEADVPPEELAIAPARNAILGSEGKTPDPDDFFSFLSSEQFHRDYWEKWPLLMRPGGVQGGPPETRPPSLDDILDDGPYIYKGDKYKPPHRTVNYLGGSFTNKDRSVAEGTPQYRADMLDALRRGYTLQILGSHLFMPWVAWFAARLGKAATKSISVNLYITPPGAGTSLPAHSDFQCAMMVHLSGRKRWRLWKKPGGWLPVRHRHIHGRDEFDNLSAEDLGPPYMDETLEPGDVLYVPRGCLHATSTPPGEVGDGGWTDGDGPSMHFTVGLEAMWDTGISATWEAFFGAGQFFRHEHAVESFYEALGNIMDKDIRFRRTLPAALVRGGTDRTWEAEARTLMHAIVDEVFDNTTFVRRVQRLVRGTYLTNAQQLLSTSRRTLNTASRRNAQKQEL